MRARGEFNRKLQPSNLETSLDVRTVRVRTFCLLFATSKAKNNQYPEITDRHFVPGCFSRPHSRLGRYSHAWHHLNLSSSQLFSPKSLKHSKLEQQIFRKPPPSTICEPLTTRFTKYWVHGCRNLKFSLIWEYCKHKAPHLHSGP